jgi:preprotein translocase subunit YajC
MNIFKDLAYMFADGATSGSSNNGSNIIFIVILGVMIVGMVLLTVLPNKRRQKDYQRMQDELRPGTRIMTIGRLIGTVERINDDNTLEVDIGTAGAPVVITISREAIGVNLDAQAAAAAAKEVKHVEETSAITEQSELPTEDKKDDII